MVRVAIGTCPSCGAALRAKAQAVRSVMQHTCCCGWRGQVAAPPELVHAAETARGEGGKQQATAPRSSDNANDELVLPWLTLGLVPGVVAGILSSLLSTWWVILAFFPLCIAGIGLSYLLKWLRTSNVVGSFSVSLTIVTAFYSGAIHITMAVVSICYWFLWMRGTDRTMYEQWKHDEHFALYEQFQGLPVLFLGAGLGCIAMVSLLRAGKFWKL